jgi:hypothetical protein
VVGGGPAGLAAALWLGRHRLRTVVADLGEYRNREVEASFGYLGFDNGKPSELIGAGLGDLARYPSVSIRRGGDVVPLLMEELAGAPNDDIKNEWRRQYDAMADDAIAFITSSGDVDEAIAPGDTVWDIEAAVCDGHSAVLGVLDTFQTVD